MRDFSFQSLHQEIRPLVLRLADFTPYQLTVRMDGRNNPATLSYIEETWNSFMEEQPVHMSFLEDDLASLYRNDEKTAIVFTVFSILAIVIASLGLLGLASFSAAQRTKEVGIRKAMGASIVQVLLTLSREFALLMGIAILLAWPLGYFFMKRWLQDYADRISLGIGTFLFSALLAFFIASVTVLLRVYAAASANPVHSLRYE
ncbi:MAG: FtsX-like permease family protein [Bacteroidales bacterium]